MQKHMYLCRHLLQVDISLHLQVFKGLKNEVQQVAVKVLANTSVVMTCAWCSWCPVEL